MSVFQTTQFKKDIQRQQKRGKDLGKLKALIELLVTSQPLPPKNRDHALAGDWAGWRDCHVEPDWVLIYKLAPDALILGRTGSHSDLF